MAFVLYVNSGSRSCVVILCFGGRGHVILWCTGGMIVFRCGREKMIILWFTGGVIICRCGGGIIMQLYGDAGGGQCLRCTFLRLIVGYSVQSGTVSVPFLTA